MGDLTINGATLIAAISGLCGVIVYLHKRADAAHERELDRLVKFYEARVADVKSLAIRSTDVTEKAVERLKPERADR